MVSQSSIAQTQLPRCATGKNVWFFSPTVSLQEERRLIKSLDAASLPGHADEARIVHGVETLLPWAVVEVQAVQGCCLSGFVSYIIDSIFSILLSHRGNLTFVTTILLASDTQASCSNRIGACHSTLAHKNRINWIFKNPHQSNIKVSLYLSCYCLRDGCSEYLSTLKLSHRHECSG